MTVRLGLGARLGLGVRMGCASTSFSPSDISGLVAWYDAAVGITKDGSNLVSAWADQSGLGHHQLQATGSAQPAWSATAGPSSAAAVVFGTDDWMKSAAFTLNQPTHVFAVMKKGVPTAANPTAWDGNTGNTMRVYYAGIAPGSDAAFVAFAGGSVGSSNHTATNWNRIEVKYYGASSLVRIGDATATTGNVGAGNAGGITLSRFGTSAGECAISLAEFIVYNTDVSVADAAAVRAYLLAKHGV